MITEQDNLCYCILSLQYVKRRYVAGYLLVPNNGFRTGATYCLINGHKLRTCLNLRNYNIIINTLLWPDKLFYTDIIEWIYMWFNLILPIFSITFTNLYPFFLANFFASFIMSSALTQCNQKPIVNFTRNYLKKERRETK